MQIPKISADDKDSLIDCQKKFSNKATLTGCSIAAASFLIIGALIVITSASLCLTIPGINVISDVVIPGIVPGGAALLLSIPCIIAGVKLEKQKKRLRKEEIDTIIALFEKHQFSQLQPREQKYFVYNNFMHHESGWTKEYRSALVKDLKKRFPEDEGSEETQKANKAINKVLDKVTKKVSKEGSDGGDDS